MQVRNRILQISNLQRQIYPAKEERKVNKKRLCVSIGRNVRVLAAAVLLILLLSQGVWAEEAQTENSQVDTTPVNFVLVLDCSATMNSNDPTDLTTSAAKLFVDMLPAENVNLAVITFGLDYSADPDRYDLNKISDLSADVSANAPGVDRIKLAWDLSDITSRAAKQKAKAAIDEAMSQRRDGEITYTPIGYGLQAAYQLLEDNGTEQDSAAIILLSDGQITGQTDSYNSGWEFSSVDSAVSKIRRMEWPIYCMELNYSGENDSGSSEGNVGSHMMREVIPEIADDHIELSSATEAQDAFASIFEKFYEVTPEVSEPMEVTNGECSRIITLDEMIAETNITLTGTAEDIGAITDIVITDNNKQSKKYIESTKDDESGNRIITFEEKYITIKLLTPAAGEWTITVHGSDGIEIGLYAVSIHEMDLKLTTTASPDADGKIAKGATVDFYASFEYHGSRYISDTVYKTYPAYLEIDGPDGDKIEMTGSEKDYSCSFTFSKSGTYRIAAYVEDENLFRGGRKESGTYTFNVGNIETKAVSEIGDKEINVGGQLEPIDCSSYFTNEDKDIITWSVDYDKISGITYDMSDEGILTLYAGTAAGEYQITVGARDPLMETDAVQTFTLKVTNQALALADGLTDGGTETFKLSYNAAVLPKIVRKFVKIPEDSKTAIIWSDYFTDPDGLPVDIEVAVSEESDAIKMDWNQDSMEVDCEDAGTAVYTVTASDQSDSSISYVLTVRIESLDAVSLLWDVIRIPVFIIGAIILALLVLLIYASTGRRVYGTWEISTETMDRPNNNLGKTSEGGKKKARLDLVLDQLGYSNNLSGVYLKAGNRISQKVYLTGLDKLDELAYKTVKYDKGKLKQKRKIELEIGKTVTLKKGTSKIKMKRTSK